PQKPVGALAALASSAPLFGANMLTNLHIPYVGPRNVSSPEIRRTNSYDVNIHVKHLKHNLVEHLEPLCVVFDTHEEARSFGIDYQLLAANVANAMTGKLHVILRKGDSPK